MKYFIKLVYQTNYLMLLDYVTLDEKAQILPTKLTDRICYTVTMLIGLNTRLYFVLS